MTEQNPTRLRSDPDVGLTAQQVREQEARGLSNIQPSHNTKTVGQIVRDNTCLLYTSYTRTVFEFESDALGAQAVVCGGGRYDGLVEELGGPHLPSLGFGMGLERLLLIMKAKECAFPQPPVCELYLAPIDVYKRQCTGCRPAPPRSAPRFSCP